MRSVDLRLLLPISCSLLAFAGCLQDASTSTEAGSGTSAAGGKANDPAKIMIDGSSTVWPVSMAMAEAFEGGNVQVAAPSGTSGGFKKFMAGGIDINDASRPIKEGELETCRENGIEPLELSVAIDGISVVVNKENTWCDSLTFEQLQALWEPGSSIQTWRDLNDAWPDEPVRLFGPDGDSGTFEYFTEHVVEQKKQCRDDYEPATDDSVLVKGVSGNKYALGYFGYGYYLKARKDLKGVAVAAADGEPVAPTADTIESYEYPLSRPVYIYVNTNRLSDENMAEFLRFYLGDGQKLVARAGCVRLSKDVLARSQATLEEALATQ